LNPPPRHAWVRRKNAVHPFASPERDGVFSQPALQSQSRRFASLTASRCAV
jgi:hypothetical protein